MDRERIVRLFFFGFLALMAYELYRLLEPFFAPIIWAILLAFLVHPAFLHLDHLVKRRSLAALLMTVGVTLLIIIPALWLLGRLAAEAHTLYGTITGLVKQESPGGGPLQQLLSTRPAQALGRALAKRGIKLEDEASNLMIEAAKLISGYVMTHASYVARNVVSAVIDFALMIVTFFYLLRDGNFYYDALRALTPLHIEDRDAIFETLRTTLSSVMRGLMLAALLQGVLIGGGYLVCGVPYWAFLALLTAGGGLLPIGGTGLVWVPVAVYLGYTAGWPRAAALVIWSACTAFVIDNLIKPMAMRHGTGLPTLALFFGIAGGLETYGPLGLFAGPAVISIFAALLRVYRKTYGGDETREAA